MNINPLRLGMTRDKKLRDTKQRKPKSETPACRPLSEAHRFISWMLIATQFLLPYSGQLWAAAPADALPTASASFIGLDSSSKDSISKFVPYMTAPSQFPVFSDNPADIEFFRAHVFTTPLLPVGGQTSMQENRDLADAITSYAHRQRNDDLSALLKFLDDHPNSPWRAALLFDVGKLYRTSGYISRALGCWEESWSLAKDRQGYQARAIANDTAGELAELYGRLGRMDSLEVLFSEVKDRNINGPPAAKLASARQGLAVMKYKPEEGFQCGPAALVSLREAEGERVTRPKVLSEAFSTTNGTSLAQLKQWSDEMGMHLQMARRLPGADIPLPAVVHWRAGHFAALLKRDGDRVLMKDPIFEQKVWLSQDAINDESSGYFLIDDSSLPKGWERIDMNEAQRVWGKGAAVNNFINFQRLIDIKCIPCFFAALFGDSPMAQYNFNAMLASLTVFDTPMRYKPPRGPAIRFTVTYDQFDVTDFGSTPNVGNMGPNVAFNYLSYVKYDPMSPTTADVYVRGGGTETYVIYDSGSSNYDRQEDSRAILHQNNTSNFVRSLPDGSTETFNFSMPISGGANLVFLTSMVDPQGNTNSIMYDTNYRPVCIFDAIGHTNVIQYVSSNCMDPIWFYKISQVTDPFQRSAYFEYDTNTLQLTNIEDIIGINSTFEYTTNIMSSLTTPYGTTSFTATEAVDGTNGVYDRTLQATDPEGNSEKVEFDGYATSAIAPDETTPTNILQYYAGIGELLEYRNSFYWDKNAMQQAPGDYTKAKIFHWLHESIGSPNVTGHILESEKEPLESRVYYNYPGETEDPTYGPVIEQGITNNSPSVIARILDDGTTQTYQYAFSNVYGNTTMSIDPLGRTTYYQYATNGIDLTNVLQQDGTNVDVLESITYNTQHRPLTMIDAAGQTTYFWYNAYGQVTTISNALGQTVTMDYDPYGYLTNVVGSLPGATNAYTYDSYGRVKTSTDSDGYTLTYGYDLADRITNVTHPDRTYEQIVYQFLDPILTRDRRGHWTSTSYDPLRRVKDIRDSLNRVTHFEWCGCGSLSSITDPLGNVTSWIRDVEGRPTAKIYPDLTQIQYFYATNSGRLTSVTDAQNQIKAYSYFADDDLSGVVYSNAVISTPPVYFTYDSNYNRVVTMKDGTGTNMYSYYTVTNGQLGAGKLYSVTGPWSSSTITYEYDALGRVTNRAIDSMGIGMAYDALGRVYSATNALGSFTTSYVNATFRPSSVSYPNGQGVTFSYFGVTNDLRLQTILNTNASNGTLSRFDYTQDADGQILTWTKQLGTVSTNTLTPQYDPVDQVLGAVLAQTGVASNIVHQYIYSYDPNGNRTGEQIDTSALGANYNALNQLTNEVNNGLAQFSGNISKTGVVNVNGNTAVMTNQTNFSAYVVTQNGTNHAQITAMDQDLNTGVTNYQLVVTNNGVVETLSYDLIGNLTNVTSSTFTNSYEWDAENRLTAVNENGTNRSEFSYDGTGRRVEIVERNPTSHAVISDKKFLWCGTELCEERDSTGATVTKRFFAQGEQTLGTNYFFTRDHLGSVREMTDGIGTIRCRYDYDPYGRQTTISGDLTADFGFTGHYTHSNSGLCLTLYRAYDPNIGRWISRDPIAERGGLNLYGYVANNPIDMRDRFGLIFGIDDAIVVLAVLAVVTVSALLVASSEQDAIQSQNDALANQLNSASLDLNNAGLSDLGTLGQDRTQDQIARVPDIAKNLTSCPGASISGFGPPTPFDDAGGAIVSLANQAIDPDTYDGLKTTFNSMFGQSPVPSSNSQGSTPAYIGPDGSFYSGPNPPAGYHREW